MSSRYEGSHDYLYRKVPQPFQLNTVNYLTFLQICPSSPSLFHQLQHVHQVTQAQPLRTLTDMASPPTARKTRPALPCWESQIHPRPSDLPLPPQSLGKPPSAPGSFSTESHTHPPEHSSPLQSCSSQVLPGGIPISESSGPHLMPPSSLAHLVRPHHTPRTASKGDIPSVGA